jgi:hypothetical protein
MKIKTLIIVLSIGALLSIIAAVYGPGLSGSAVAGLMSFPFAQIGGLLRALSLAGAFGNIAAILLYAALGLAPLLLLFWRVRKKKAHLEDSLLVALSALLFFMMYLMINPALISKMFVPGSMSGVGKAVLGGTFYSLLIGYLIFRLLRRISRSGTAEMLKWLQLIFALIAAALVFSVFYLALLGIIGNIQEVKLANTDPAVSLAMTNTFIVIRFVLQQIPVFLAVVTGAHAAVQLEPVFRHNLHHRAVALRRRRGRLPRLYMDGRQGACRFGVGFPGKHAEGFLPLFYQVAAAQGERSNFAGKGRGKGRLLPRGYLGHQQQIRRQGRGAHQA